jgi:hypothetical protein
VDSATSSTSMDISIFGSVIGTLDGVSYPIVSRYYCPISLDTDVKIGGEAVSLVPRNGKGASKLNAQTPLEPVVIGGSDAVFVSLSLDCGDEGVRLNQIFTVQVLVVNAGETPRNFRVIVPDRYKGTEGGVRGSVRGKAGIVVGSRDFYAQYMEFEKREATIVCLEEDTLLRYLKGIYF